MSDASLRVIDRHAQRPQKVLDSIQTALRQGLVEAETHVKVNMLSGTYRAGQRNNGQTPVAVRSGSLRQAITHGMESEFMGFVGVTRGPASRYARTILGDQDTVITPKSSKYLTIPIADNLTPSGQPRFPSVADAAAAFGEESIEFIRSKSGNLVIFARTGGTYKRATKGGRKAGDAKGKLLFVLKKSVTIKGTDALAKGVQQQRDRIHELLEQGLMRGLEAV